MSWGVWLGQMQWNWKSWNPEILKEQKGDDGREGRNSANSPVSSLDMEWILALPLPKLEIAVGEKGLGR